MRVSKSLVNKLIQETLKEVTETSKRISPRLIYLAKLAKHYKTFKEFENDYQIKNFHGIYWHLTTNPNFVINPKQAPTDLSSLASGPGSTPGLMVSTDIGNWHATFNQRRQYAVQIDLSDLIPNVDYRGVNRGFGHEIFVFKPEGAKVVKILPISKALKQNYDDYRRNLPQNQEQLKRLYDLVHQKDIQENANQDILKITKEDEYRAIQFIKKKYAPIFGDDIGRRLKKINHIPTEDPKNSSDHIHYELENKRSLFVINKSSKGMWIANYDWGEKSPSTMFYIDVITESIEEGVLKKEMLKISKLEEDEGLNYIKHSVIPQVMPLFNGWVYEKNYVDPQNVKKGLKKIIHEPIQLYKGNNRDFIGWQYEEKGYDFTFFLVKYDHGILFAGYEDPFKGTSYFVVGKQIVNPHGVVLPFDISKIFHKTLNESINHLHTDIDQFRINKEEEDRTFQQIKKFLIGSEMVGKTLRKVRHVKNPNGADVIDYMTGDESTTYPYLIRIMKSLDDNIYASYPQMLSHNRSEEIDIPFGHYHKLSINENYEPPNLHISKEEEDKAYQILRGRHNNQGETIGRYLKKIRHDKSDNAKYTDKIIYLNTDDGTTYTLQKDIWGKLGVRAGYIATSTSAGYTSNTLDPLEVPIHENAPTGDWQSWGMVTQPEKDRLKIVLDGFIRHIRNIYHPHLSEPKAYLIKKAIDNLDVSDPRFSAKPLAKLGMEDRLALGDFVDHADTSGTSSRVMNFLMNMSRQYIQPPRSPEPDIILDKIARVIWPSGTRMSDVTIHGLDDMRPIIGFGHGGYSLTDNFIKQYSKPGAELYIDLGADVRVTNMSDVMKAVKYALERDKRTIYENLSEVTILSEPIVLSKEDEARAVQFIRNFSVGGNRVGKTLKKTHIEKSDTHNLSNTVYYSANIEMIRYDFEIFKSLRRGIVVIDLYNRKSYEIDKMNKSSTTLNEAAISSYHPNYTSKSLKISKKEEDFAFEFLKNKVVDGERLGKTLKKWNSVKSSNWSISDVIIYTANVKGQDKYYQFIKEVDGTIIRLKIQDISPGGSSRKWIVPI